MLKNRDKDQSRKQPEQEVVSIWDVKEALLLGAPLAVETLRKLLENPETPPDVLVDAATTILKYAIKYEEMTSP